MLVGKPLDEETVNMPRPRSQRRIAFEPHVTYFKPRGVPLNELDVVELTHEEVEAFRLKYHEGLDQADAALQMHTSSSTFQRILWSAQRKLADGIVNGKALQISD